MTVAQLPFRESTFANLRARAEASYNLMATPTKIVRGSSRARRLLNQINSSCSTRKLLWGCYSPAFPRPVLATNARMRKTGCGVVILADGREDRIGERGWSGLCVAESGAEHVQCDCGIVILMNVMSSSHPGARGRGRDCSNSSSFFTSTSRRNGRRWCFT